MNPGNTGTYLHTVTYSELYDLMKREFVGQLASLPIDAQPLFIKRSIPMHSGNIRRFQEDDMSTYAKLKPEGQDAKKGNYGIGYFKDMVSKRIALEMPLTYEARTQDQWSRVGEIIRGLAETPINRINLDMTHRLTFSNVTSYVDMDGSLVDVSVGNGLSLINNAHTLAFSANTYSNRVPLDPAFSQTALEAAELLAVTNIVDNYGVRKVMKFTHIITTDNPETVNAVRTFLNSTSNVNQANSGVINVYRTKYEHLVLHSIDTDANGSKDLTKSKWWFLAALTGADRLQAYYGEWDAPAMNPMPTNSNYGVDVHNDDFTYGVRAMYGLAIVSGRGIIGSLAV